jgi:hypothetical protein
MIELVILEVLNSLVRVFSLSSSSSRLLTSIGLRLALVAYDSILDRAGCVGASIFK